MSNLDLKFYSRDLDEELTIRAYFQKLLTTLLEEGEGFSGKRPFGNSGWQHDLYVPLIVAGLVEGAIDEDGCIDSVDENDCQKILIGLIAEMCSAK